MIFNLLQNFISELKTNFMDIFSLSIIYVKQLIKQMRSRSMSETVDINIVVELLIICLACSVRKSSLVYCVLNVPKSSNQVLER